ncbi:MAG: hypothetical protein ABW124_08830 [Candidatus Thiodiazotropha sp. 6PLUC9]
MCKDTQTAATDCQACVLLARAMDTTALAQSGFSDLGALCQAIQSACDQLAGIGQYLADDWINSLDGELETLATVRQTRQ